MFGGRQRCPAGPGEANGRLSAYDAASSKVLWTYQTGASVGAPPMSYAANGRQFIAVATGATQGSGDPRPGGSLRAFSLPKNDDERRGNQHSRVPKASRTGPRGGPLEPLPRRTLRAGFLDGSSRLASPTQRRLTLGFNATTPEGLTDKRCHPLGYIESALRGGKGRNFWKDWSTGHSCESEECFAS